jgi:predicted outer membrane repeat protein
MPIYNPAAAGGGGGGAGAFTGNVAHKLCSGTFTVTLYPVAGNSGQILFIKNTSTGTITISGDSAGETIDSDVSAFLTVENSSFQLVTDGVDWFII